MNRLPHGGLPLHSAEELSPSLPFPQQRGQLSSRCPNPVTIGIHGRVRGTVPSASVAPAAFEGERRWARNFHGRLACRHDDPTSGTLFAHDRGSGPKLSPSGLRSVTIPPDAFLIVRCLRP